MGFIKKKAAMLIFFGVLSITLAQATSMMTSNTLSWKVFTSLTAVAGLAIWLAIFASVLYFKALPLWKIELVGVIAVISFGEIVGIWINLFFLKELGSIANFAIYLYLLWVISEGMDDVWESA